MKNRILFFAAAVLFAGALSSHASLQDPSSQTPEKPIYYAYGNEPTVLGTVSVKGKLPPRKKIDVWADPVCAKLDPNPQTDWPLLKGQNVQNAFVYIKEGEPLNMYRFAVPDTEVTLEHKKCQYSPHVLGLRVGQSLAIANSDPTQHNTHPTPKSNEEWNYSQAAKAPPLIKTFTRPEVMIPFKCNQHPWERAYIGVLSHPFFAVTDSAGNYEIRGLPPGTYKLAVWYELLGEREIEITVAAGESRRVDFTLDADKLIASPSLY